MELRFGTETISEINRFHQERDANLCAYERPAGAIRYVIKRGKQGLACSWRNLSNEEWSVAQRVIDKTLARVNT